MKKKVMGEDFCFSAKQLRVQRKYCRDNHKRLTLTFINGKQFTQREEHPFVSNWDDAVIVAENIIGASETNPDYKITYKYLTLAVLYLTGSLDKQKS